MSQLKLILREDVPNLGEAGDLVSVKPGYARNFLIPKGKAIFATDAGMKQLEHHKRVVEEKLLKELDSLKAVHKKLEKLTIEVTARAGEEGKLFGSVTTVQIVQLIRENGVEVDRRRVGLSEPIKALGKYKVPVKLHRDLIAEVLVVVSPEEVPAAAEPAEVGDADDHTTDDASEEESGDDFDEV